MAAPMTRPALNVLELQRVSTNKQDLERQEYDLADNRVEYNLNPVKKFSIKESGEKVLTTEDFAELLEELKRPSIDGLNVSAVDRMARPQDMASFGVFQDFITYKKVIISKREGLIEPWTPRGRKVLMAALMQAGNELSDLKDRLQSNRRKMHAKKRMCNTTPPYGMVYVSKYERDSEGRCQYLKEDPRESSVAGLTRKQVVILVFNWRYLNRLRISAIKRRLNQMGILTAGKPGQWEPGPWSRTTVIQMLKNRHYVGEHWEGDTMLPCPQFVDREVFDGVQKMFAEAKQMTNGRPATKHLLCGWLRCKYCRRRYRTVTGTGGKYHSYICGNHDSKLNQQICRANTQIRCTAIEAVVWTAIWKHLTQADLLLANAKAYYDSLPSKSGTAKLEKELAAVIARMERTRRMVRAGTEDENTGNALILEDKRRIAEIESELRAAGSVMALPSRNAIEAGCRRIAQGPEPTTFEERRPILEKLVDLKMTWDRGAVEIEGKVPVPEAVASSGTKMSKCDRRVRAYNTSVLYIPFKIKERVA